MSERSISITRGDEKKVSHSYSLKDTEKIARELTRRLSGGDVIALSGELGAGKTTFVQGIAREFGIKDAVTSPTFVIMNAYEVSPDDRGITALCHIDAYRLEKGKELASIGVEEYMGNPSVVTLIEWPERVAEILPESTLWVEITISR